MNKKQKHILFVLKRHRHKLFETVQRHAKKADWAVDFYHHSIPEDWYGDGVITDYAAPGELDRLKNAYSIPIVSRIPKKSLPNYDKYNIRSVLGCIHYNAEMIFDFFRSRGHINFAGVNLTKVMSLDPVSAFEQVVIENGFRFTYISWEDILEKSLHNNFSAIVELLKKSFNKLETPCAMFVNDISRIHYVYRCCEEAGIRIPEDIAIIANTDDPAFGENLVPSATVISGEIEQTGPVMVDLLERMMAGQNDSREPVLIKADNIIARESTRFFATQHKATLQTIDFILAHYGNKNLDINMLAQNIGVSRKTLQRNLKKHLNTQPNDFIRQHRLEKACQLLKETKMSVSEIASRVGYSSNIALSKAFKNQFGIMPGQYRKKLTCH